MAMTTGGGGLANLVILASGAAFFLLDLVIMVFAVTFLQAAALRGTLYDSFSAGWRLDRLFQMVVRDFGGFCKVLLVTLIGAVASSVYAFVVAMVATLVLMGGLLSATAVIGLSDGYMTGWHFLADQLLRMGAGPVLLFVLLLMALLFVGNVISTAMNLVSVNAMGQWFARFDVNRWGVSSAPLPDDVPRRGARTAYTSAPVDPMASTAGEPDCAASAPTDAARPVDPVDSVQPVEPIDSAASSDPVEPLEPADSAEAEAKTSETAQVEAVEETQVDANSDVEKKPIPLGSISTDDAPVDEDGGPIAE